MPLLITQALTTYMLNLNGVTQVNISGVASSSGILAGRQCDLQRWCHAAAVDLDSTDRSPASSDSASSLIAGRNRARPQSLPPDLCLNLKRLPQRGLFHFQLPHESHHMARRDPMVGANAVRRR
jgi:hypothetical protein